MKHPPLTDTVRRNAHLSVFVRNDKVGEAFRLPQYITV